MGRVKGGSVVRVSVPSFFLFIHLAALGLHYHEAGWGRGFSVVVQRLSSYGVQAYLARGQWDLIFMTKD